jgi:hypothetical protein
MTTWACALEGEPVFAEKFERPRETRFSSDGRTVAGMMTMMD